MENNFTNEYNRLLKLIENKIIKFVPKIRPETLYEPFLYSMTQGGKRIRPILTILTAKCLKPQSNDAIDLALAIEILHNFTLVHDDIMDESPFRRNNPTVYKKWDSATAILTGDIMVGYAYKLIGLYKNHSNFSRLLDVFTNGLVEVCEGQAYDMQFNNDTNVKANEYFLMIYKKTAMLLKTAALLGAYYGEANVEQIESLKNYSEFIGLAFQLQDDLLDLTADEKKLGKKIGQDIIEGKKTYMIILAKDRAELKKDKILINKFYRRNGLDYDEVPKMIELFDRLKIFDDVEKEINEYFKKAEKSLIYLPNNFYKEMLEWLILKLKKRKY